MLVRVPRWFLCAILVSPGWYVASTTGAADRARLAAADLAVARAYSDIRTLETEFAARASLGQLERWNLEINTLAVPRADQFVSEAALAALDPNPLAPVQAVAAVTARPRADRRAPQLAMLDPALRQDASFDGLRSAVGGEGGLR